MGLWLRLWHGIDDSASDDRLRDVLTRLEGQKSTWTLYDAGTDHYDRPEYHSDGSESHHPLHGSSVLDVGRAGSERHVLDNTENWVMTMKFVRSTPDGPLTTTVYSGARKCRVAIHLDGTGLLEEFYFFAHELADPRRATKLGARVNRFAVRHVRDWVRRRVIDAFAAAKAERDEQREAERRKREEQLSSMRSKYVP